jgi:hypothetical protein
MAPPSLVDCVALATTTTPAVVYLAVSTSTRHSFLLRGWHVYHDLTHLHNRPHHLPQHHLLIIPPPQDLGSSTLTQMLNYIQG